MQIDSNNHLAGSPVQTGAAGGTREPITQRAREEPALRLSGPARRAARLVSELLQREYEVAEDYDNALDADLAEDARRLARDFRGDHDYQATAMRDVLERLGVPAQRANPLRRLKSRGRLWLARVNPRRSVLEQLRREEVQLAHQLRDAASHCDALPRTREALQRGTAMAEKHASRLHRYQQAAGA